MKQARLMNREEDYAKLGLKRDRIEPWEDGRRDTDARGHWEWWYFDVVLDDGRTLVVQFLQKGLRTVNDSVGHPCVNFQITEPDGTKHTALPEYSVDECSWANDRCEVSFGPNVFEGDLKTYNIHAEVEDGLGCDVTLVSSARPYRPETGYFEFGNDYYTWLCVVPRGDVSGTVTVDGVTSEVSGRGYHDHQWGSNIYVLNWNHWIWARQAYDDYVLLLFPMTASRKYGYKEFPIVFVQDAEGSIVFQSTEGGKVELLDEYIDDKSGKPYPSKVRYTATGNGTRLTYTLGKKDVLQSEDAMALAPAPLKSVFKLAGMQPSYARFLGEGEMCLELSNHEKAIERKADLI